MASERLDAVIHQPVRLQIMAALFRNRQASFTALRDGLGLTAGNLASHAATLEQAGYIETGKALTPSGFELRYRITPRGSDAFRAYLAHLRHLIDLAGGPSPGAADPEHGPTGASEDS